MIIDSTTLLLLSIIFATLSISEKAVKILNKKGYLQKLMRFISKNKNKIEESIKSNKSLIVDDDKDIDDIICEIKDMEEIIVW